MILAGSLGRSGLEVVGGSFLFVDILTCEVAVALAELFWLSRSSEWYTEYTTAPKPIKNTTDKIVKICFMPTL